MDQLGDMASQSAYGRGPRDLGHLRQQPRTAGFDCTRLSQQQQELLLQRQHVARAAGAPGPAMYESVSSSDVQAMQMHMMQMEIMRLQAVAQMQQYAQLQASGVPHIHSQQQWREPATAGARAVSFVVPDESPVSQNDGRHYAHDGYMDEYSNAMPMTAALGGRFGSRVHAESVPYIVAAQGNSTGRSAHMSTPASAGLQGPNMAPSKSDSAASWRSTSRSVLSNGRGVDRSLSNSPPKVSPPSSDSERASPPLRMRPEPLRFSSKPAVDAFAISSTDESETCDDSSSSKSDSDLGSSSSPTTPLSGSSHISSSSAREEASKKLFQGLGIGRPSIQVVAPAEIMRPRTVSQPIRQPRGPPGAADELGDKNFANRIRKKAIGGLGALLEAREKRDWDAEGESC